ncbi:MAG: hypothetical protein HC857_08025 [Synechococcales cyanobacterium RU_4_20]|nr:hypothetical protein [Synechococcales cyanobacterium RU_4_20]NJR69603.1 hypothetical protein [Synechococcales cyanobacterium CRU_2_2]
MTPSPFTPDPFGLQKTTKSERLLGKKIPLIDRSQIAPNAPAMPEPLQVLDPMLRHILSSMPTEIRQSLSERQLNALNKAIATNATQHHLDIRKTVRFFTQRYYVVLLAGPEQRSPERLKQTQRPWSSLSTAVFTLLALSLGLTLYQAGYQQFLESPTPKSVANPLETTHPAALPWIQSEAECKGADRHWQDDLCYDSSHSPEF